MMVPRAVVVVCLGSALCRGADPSVYSVCEILSHLEEFSCRPVHIRARLVADVDEWLVGENCPKSIEVAGTRFEDLIKLQSPSSPVAGCRVGWSDDEESDRKIREVFRRYDGGRKVRIYVTIAGVIETRNPPYALAGKRPGWRLGFGHLGMAPAQIIVKRVVRVEVPAAK